jgi:anti-sigma regulatory factor (Ser/Thr protein kinase)
VQTQWPPEPSHVGDARRFVEDRLLADRLTNLVETSLLIVSELATNAVRHARSPFRVTMVREDDRLRLEVHDDSPAPAALCDHAPEALDGRGLHLVSTLSSEWGVTPHPNGGKSVWAMVAIPGAAQSRVARPR